MPLTGDVIGSDAEATRSQLASDLHGGVAQDLTAARLVLEMLDSDGATTTELLAAARESVDNALVSVRELIRELRPVAYDQLGFMGALHALAHDATAGGLPTTCRADGELPDLEELDEVGLLRKAASLLELARESGAEAATLIATADAGSVNVAVTARLSA